MIEVITARVMALIDVEGPGSSEYAAGAQQAIAAAVRYGISVIDQASGEDWVAPPDVLTQARLAARHDVPLETVQRRYFVGRDLFVDFTLTELESVGEVSDFRPLLGALTKSFSSLLAEIEREYLHERQRAAARPKTWLCTQVLGLLSGDQIDRQDLGYDLNAIHIGIVSESGGAGALLRQVAGTLDAQALAVENVDGRMLAWVGRRQGFEETEVKTLLENCWQRTGAIGIGVPAFGLTGWRRSHRQAEAALWLAMHRKDRLAWFADDPLLLPIARDDLATISLRTLYLEPLCSGSARASNLPDTLHAYFATGWNAASAAAVLGVSRQAVTSRISRAERLIGHSIASCAAELSIALKLDELGRFQESSS